MNRPEEQQSPDTDNTAFRDRLTQEYCSQWRTGSVPSLSEFIGRHEGLTLRTIADLVLVDMQERTNLGQSIDVEQYYTQFPALKGDSQLVAELNAAEHDLTAARYSTYPVVESQILPPNVLEATSTRLLRRAAGGEQKAWELLVQIYGPVVRYWCRKSGLNKTDVGDVFSETFLAVVRNLSTFERQEGKAKFRAWLKTVTLSKVNNHFTKLGKQPIAFGGSTAMMHLAAVAANPGGTDEFDNVATEDDDALAHSEEAFVAQRIVQIVRSEFRDNTWQAFQLTAIEGCTSQQAAKELNMTPLAVRKAKSRVMTRLKKLLQECGVAGLAGDITSA